MYTKSWHVIKDDTHRTFEVVTNGMSENAFTNKTHAMQRNGMNVSCMLLPITNKNPSRTSIKLIGYTAEEGLYAKLEQQYNLIIQRNIEDW